MHILTSITIKERGIMSKTCSVEGCENKHLAKSYCNRHYKQFRKYGYILDIIQHDSNEIIEYEDYAEIILYNKNGNEVARTIIDLEYIDIIKQYKWHLTNNGYVYNNQVRFLHRLITNCPEDMIVDHINHDPLDNRISNLRVCTVHQNNMNTGQRCNTSSGVTGVSWYSQTNKWEAYISINGKRTRLGYFKTKEEAINARKQAEIEYFGEFAPTKQD